MKARKHPTFSENMLMAATKCSRKEDRDLCLSP